MARVFLLGAGFLVSGVVIDSPPLLVPGAALTLLAVLALLASRLGAAGARVERDRLPSRVVEGVPFAIGLHLRAGALPLPVTLIDAAIGEPVRVGWRRPGSWSEMRAEGVLEGRGHRAIGPPRLRMADPLGIASREVSGSDGATLLVLPRIEEIAVPGGERGGSLVAMALRGSGERDSGAGRQTPSEVDLEGLRPYRPGTPASRIHWPAFARRGELLERRFTQLGGAGPLVALDPSGPVSPGDLDRAVRAAASLCSHLARRGGCELVLPGASRRLAVDAGMAGWSEAHAGLAVITENAGRPAIATVGADRAIFWVVASPAVQARPPSGRGFVISPQPLAGGPPAFSVAGCHARPIEPGARVHRGGEVAA